MDSATEKGMYAAKAAMVVGLPQETVKKDYQFARVVMEKEPYAVTDAVDQEKLKVTFNCCLFIFNSLSANELNPLFYGRCERKGKIEVNELESV